MKSLKCLTPHNADIEEVTKLNFFHQLEFYQTEDEGS